MEFSSAKTLNRYIKICTYRILINIGQFVQLDERKSPHLTLKSFSLKADSDRLRIHVDQLGDSEFAKDLDTQTALSYVRRNAWTSALEEATSAAYRVISGSELGAMSALYLMTYAGAAGNFRVLIESSKESAQGMKIKASNVTDILSQ